MKLIEGTWWEIALGFVGLIAIGIIVGVGVGSIIAGEPLSGQDGWAWAAAGTGVTIGGLMITKAIRRGV